VSRAHIWEDVFRQPVRTDRLSDLREQIDEINLQILNLLSRRGALVQEIGKVHAEAGSQFYHPDREEEMLSYLVEANGGPYPDETVIGLFKEIFKASLDLQKEQQRETLMVSRKSKDLDTVIEVKGLRIGAGSPIVVAGPCSIESWPQLDEIARAVSCLGAHILRGGAFKPRTSPYSFQGLGREGLEYMSRAAVKYGLISVTEVLDTRDIDLVSQFVDILQIGARNMQNFALLKAAGSTSKPILLKRGFMVTVEELLYAAEYIMLEGNEKIILCERGIRTFERWTRNTLDISAVALIKRLSHLPVIVDISHSAGRKDIAIPLAKAALAVGADGIMVEVHNNPSVALSDAQQQLSIEEFEQMMSQALSLLSVEASPRPAPATIPADPRGLLLGRV
jgi:3-deoxy-7-phosphoheptulonate synthase/chorismate mutase